MARKNDQRSQAMDKKHQIVLLAELTHQLTGEQESDIRGYLEKFGIEAFFARVHCSDCNTNIKEALDKLCKDLG